MLLPETWKLLTLVCPDEQYVRPRAAAVRVEVRDHGIGVSPGKQIFERSIKLAKYAIRERPTRIRIILVRAQERCSSSDAVSHMMPRRGQVVGGAVISFAR